MTPWRVSIETKIFAAVRIKFYTKLFPLSIYLTTHVVYLLKSHLFKILIFHQVVQINNRPGYFEEYGNFLIYYWSIYKNLLIESFRISNTCRCVRLTTSWSLIIRIMSPAISPAVEAIELSSNSTTVSPTPDIRERVKPY